MPWRSRMSSECSRRDRMSLPAIELRSSILAAWENSPEAVQDITELLEKEPDNVLLKLQLAIYLNAANQSRQGDRGVQRGAAGGEPQNGVALRGRADAYLNIGEHRKAIADYEVAAQVVRRRLGHPQ